MSRIYTAADQLIGHTPLLELTHLKQEFGLKARIVANIPCSRRDGQCITFIVLHQFFDYCSFSGT